MQALIHLVIFLIVDKIFRDQVMAPVLKKNGIEPYKWSKHYAGIKAITDYIKYWIYTPKDSKGILRILISIAIQCYAIWVIMILVKTFGK